MPAQCVVHARCLCTHCLLSYIHAVLSASPFNTDAATSKHRMRNVAVWHGRIIHAGSFEVGQP
jgi:hypothetical protein